MPKAIKDGKLQSILDCNNFPFINLPGAISGSGHFAIASNLSEGIPATIRANIGLPASVSGQALLSTVGVTGVTIPQVTFVAGVATVSYRLLAQTRSDIGAQPASANLNTLSAVAATDIGLDLLGMSTPLTTSYIQATSGGGVALKTKADLQADVFSGLTILDSTGSFQTDGTVVMNDFNSAGTIISITENVSISAPLTVTGGNLIVLGSVAGSDVTIPLAGILATLSEPETFENKTLTAPDINGGTVDAITSLGIQSGGLLPFDLKINNIEDLSANRTLTIKLNNTSRTLSLGGNLTTGGTFATSGAVSIGGAFTTLAPFSVAGVNTVVLTTNGPTSVTLPTTGALATLAGSETLSSKTITAPTINGGTHTAITSFGLRSTGAAFDLKLASVEAIGADKTITINVSNSNMSLGFTGNVSFGGTFTTHGTMLFSGAFSTLITSTAPTTLTLPTSGTVASFITGRMPISGTAATFGSGTGTPEGAVTAAIGSLYTRVDGGADTTLYVKESGAGNTGWVAM